MNCSASKLNHNRRMGEEATHCRNKRHCGERVRQNCKITKCRIIEEIVPKGGFRAENSNLPSTFDFEYTTTGGVFRFHCVLIRKPGECYYEPEIVVTPPIDSSRSQNEHIIHTSPSSSGGRMICRGDYKTEFATPEGAKDWAEKWAFYFDLYNRTGQKFPGDE